MKKWALFQQLAFKKANVFFRISVPGLLSALEKPSWNSKSFHVEIFQAVTGTQRQEDKEKVLWVKFEQGDINGMCKILYFYIECKFDTHTYVWWCTVITRLKNVTYITLLSTCLSLVCFLSHLPCICQLVFQ